MNNYSLIFELWKRKESLFKEGNINELEIFAENLKGIEKEIASNIEELKNEFKRNKPIQLDKSGPNLHPIFAGIINSFKK